MSAVSWDCGPVAIARIEPPDPPTDPPEEPRREDGPCELCAYCTPLVSIDGEQVTVRGYEFPCSCYEAPDFPVLVDGAKLGSVQGCECFERRVR